ncbi:MAG TPA: MFS transporter [Candidatus Paceibacterota bacterium]|nr:MFS transporter [Candidatus Paceibacterota bacterium]HQI26034.1 MFS transporter [Candidatus Paceibacterota bacterium]HQJ83805.1 MFS transporter [Candidatus Paceibacterota bacterium]
MRSQKTLILFTYLCGLTMTFSFAFPGYVNSTFLENFVGEKWVGFIFAIGALLSVILMSQISKLIKAYGNIKVLVSSAALAIFVLILLALAKSVTVIISTFIIYYCLGFFIRYTLDVYLENISDDKNTGLIRGFYLTFLNTAWLISPFLASRLVVNGDFWKIYVVAAMSLLPLIAIASVFLYEQKDLKYDGQSIFPQLKRLWRGENQTDRCIRRILIVDFLLCLFYAVMVIYMPLYLHEHLGLPWNELGLVFTIMLVPFVILELPLGRIADRWMGEKEILMGGLVITGLSTSVLAFIPSASWLVWAGLLFITRVGAAGIEVMKEAYLFKKIDGSDTSLISLSRIIVPFSYLVGPLFVSLILLFFDFNYVFFFLGLLVLSGLFFATKLKDTK